MGGMNSALLRNIEAMRQRQQQEDAGAGFQEKLAGGVTAFTGSMVFVYVHLAIVAVWIAVNVGAVPGVRQANVDLVWDPQWGMDFCMTDHVVYLANSSGIKVGITRATQLPTRWLDQGASQALPIMRVATRQQSGMVEDLLRSQVADRTNWRALLKGDAEPIDLIEMRERIFDACADGVRDLQQRYGLQAIQPVADAEVVEIRYPVEAYPTKVVSLDLDKTPVVEGTLLGIKGQYLILDTGVINIRKFTAYQVAASAAA